MTNPATQYGAYRALRTFPLLDGLRALCILPVMFHHASGGITFGRLSERGFLGVDMFFVLSGFLIVTLLLREQERTSDISLSNFYIRRSLRIMPVYYGIIAMCALVYGLVVPAGDGARAFFRDLPYCLTYTTNWVPTTGFLLISWSLSAEEQFYLVWPVIQKTVRNPIPILLMLIVISQIIHFGLADGLLQRLGKGPDQLKMLRQTTFTPILSGVLLAYALHFERSFVRVYRLVGHRLAPPLLTAALLVSLMFLPLDLRGWPRLWIHMLLPCLLASIVLRTDHGPAPLLASRPIARIGVLSYGMYLLHPFAIAAVTRALPRMHLPEVLTFPATLCATYVLAELSFRFYESFFLRLKDRFQKPRTPFVAAHDARPSRPPA